MSGRSGVPGRGVVRASMAVLVRSCLLGALVGAWAGSSAWSQEASSGAASTSATAPVRTAPALPARSTADAASLPDAATRAEIDALEPAVAVGNIISVAANPAPPARRGAAAIDTLDLGTTSITGTQELPKVLYIVPWKKSDLGDLVGRPVNTLLDEVLAPVDPEVFERHLEYYETLYGDSHEE